jgi:hypothetical protein
MILGPNVCADWAMFQLKLIFSWHNNNALNSLLSKLNQVKLSAIEVKLSAALRYSNTKLIYYCLLQTKKSRLVHPQKNPKVGDGGTNLIPVTSYEKNKMVCMIIIIF